MTRDQIIADADACYSWLYASGYGEGPVERLIAHAGQRLFACRQVLDAGCGRQGFARRMQQLGFDGEIVGVDVSSYVVMHSSGVCPVTHASLDSLPFSDQQFDGLFCCDVLEHIARPLIDGVLTELSRVLTDGCVWAFSIGTKHSCYCDPQGRSLHVTIDSPSTWTKRLAHFGFARVNGFQLVQGGIIVVGVGIQPAVDQSEESTHANDS